MAILGDLPRALGRGTRKLAAGNASVTGNAAVATGLDSVEEAVVSVKNAPAGTVPFQTANISAVSGGSITVRVWDHTTAAGAEHAASTTARVVSYLAVGS